MSSPLPPDPYAALGVPRDATSATIKSAYRKLALRCHPDKITDPTLKVEKANEFHRIQQAYEILGEDEKRERYNAQVRLAELRREAMERQGRGGPKVDVRPASYEVRTPSGAAYPARGPTMHEVPRSRAAHDDEDRYYDEPRRSAKYAYSKRSSTPTRSTRDGDRARTAESDRARSERQKSRDKATKKERFGKFTAPHAESDDSDENRRRKQARDAMYEREQFQRERETREAEDARRRAEAIRRDEEARRVRKDDTSRRSSQRKRAEEYDDDSDDVQSRYTRRTEDAMDYIRRAEYSPRVSKEDARPSGSRSSSMREPLYEHRKNSSGRPETIRRSSAAASSKERIADGVRYGSGSSRRDRGAERKGSLAGIAEDRGVRPTLEKSDSSPAAMKSAAAAARAPPPRASTMDYDRSAEYPAQPSMRRAETMPMPSKLRTEIPATTMNDSGYSSSTTASPERDPYYKPQGPPPSTVRKIYSYSVPGSGGVSLGPEYATVEIKPGKGSDSPVREREREPHKPERPTMAKVHTVPTLSGSGSKRMVYTTADSPIDAPPRPPLARGDSSATYTTTRASEPDRERERGRAYERADPTSRSAKGEYLYGEIPARSTAASTAGSTRPERPGMKRGDSYRREDVIYSQPIRPENVSYASSSSNRRPRADMHSYSQPTVRRSATAI